MKYDPAIIHPASIQIEHTSIKKRTIHKILMSLFILILIIAVVKFSRA